MSLIDFLETWWLSVLPFIVAAGVVGRFERSPVDRPNPSCALNFSRDAKEADLLIWESGEAEFTTIEADGSTNQQHFDDVRRPSALGMILSCCLRLASSESTL